MAAAAAALALLLRLTWLRPVSAFCVLLLVAVRAEDVHTQALVHGALQRRGSCLQLKPLLLDELIYMVLLHD
jgi:hypothetical protein